MVTGDPDGDRELLEIQTKCPWAMTARHLEQALDLILAAQQLLWQRDHRFHFDIIDLVGHGTPGSLRLGAKHGHRFQAVLSLHPRAFTTLSPLRRVLEGGQLRLIACHVGTEPPAHAREFANDGVLLAMALARSLHVAVQAAHTVVLASDLDSNGNLDESKFTSFSADGAYESAGHGRAPPAAETAGFPPKPR